MTGEMEARDGRIDALNDLIRVVADGHQALRSAVERLEPDQGRPLCADLAERQAGLVRELQALVAALGGAPEATGTLFGGARRLVAELGAALGARDSGDILAGLIRQQEETLTALDRAAARDMTPELAAELTRIGEGLRQDRTRLEAARESLRPETPAREASRPDTSRLDTSRLDKPPLDAPPTGV
ncbi:MAG: hypothetical protein RLY86_2315 [Pseudomonadota bacterium]|jgi:uncharacterized protein (TIGR02284 family)